MACFPSSAESTRSSSRSQRARVQALITESVGPAETAHRYDQPLEHPCERHLRQRACAPAQRHDRICIRHQRVARMVEACCEDDIDPGIGRRGIELRKNADRIALRGERRGDVARARRRRQRERRGVPRGRRARGSGARGADLHAPDMALRSQCKSPPGPRSYGGRLLRSRPSPWTWGGPDLKTRRRGGLDVGWRKISRRKRRSRRDDRWRSRERDAFAAVTSNIVQRAKTAFVIFQAGATTAIDTQQVATEKPLVTSFARATKEHAIPRWTRIRIRDCAGASIAESRCAAMVYLARKWLGRRFLRAWCPVVAAHETNEHQRKAVEWHGLMSGERRVAEAEDDDGVAAAGVAI